MEKKDKIISLINQIGEVQERKREATTNQKYEDAASARDDERVLLKKLDLESGVDDFYKKVYTTEKILEHIDIITNSVTELKKLRPNFDETIALSTFDKWLVKLLKERDEAYEAVLQIRSLMK